MTFPYTDNFSWLDSELLHPPQEQIKAYGGHFAQIDLNCMVLK